MLCVIFFCRLEQDEIEDGVKPSNCDWWNGKDTDVLFQKYFFDGEWNDWLLAILRFFIRVARQQKGQERKTHVFMQSTQPAEHFPIRSM
jgi:hypothetical protein